MSGAVLPRPRTMEDVLTVSLLPFVIEYVGPKQSAAGAKGVVKAVTKDDRSDMVDDDAAQP